VRERLGAAVRDLRFDRAEMRAPALSVPHARELFERTAGPMIKLVESLGSSDPSKLAEFRREFEEVIAEYYEDNAIRQNYLMTRATKI
jgi:hypothetical protein